MENKFFDIHEPYQGHEDRFLYKLSQYRRKKKRKRQYIIMIAASLLMLITATWWGKISAANGTKNKLPMELQQGQAYFSEGIIRSLKELEQAKSPATEELYRQALMNMKKMDADYNELIIHYQQNPNKHLINAMMDNLRRRLKILEQLKKQMHLIQIQNNRKDENNHT